MADNSKIQWTDATWQVTAGCSRVSAGCENCYAIRDAHRMAGNPKPKISAPRQGVTAHRGGRLDWTGKLNLMPQNLAVPLKWKRGRKIFVNSNSDLFHAAVPFEYIAAVFGVMAACPQHTFQILTKRPERMNAFFEWIEIEGKRANCTDDHVVLCATQRAFERIGGRLVKTAQPQHWPLKNVWLGVSVENQETAEARIPLLLQCPAAIRFVSYEPATGPVDFGKVVWGPPGKNAPQILGALPDKNEPDDWRYECRRIGIHLIIVGGESGPGARPFDIAWARSVIAQCKAAGVACFVKQLGSNPVTDSAAWDEGQPAYRKPLKDRKGGSPEEWPADLRVRELPEVKPCG